MNVIVAASGAIDAALPVFQSGEVSILVVTTQQGAERIQTHALPQTAQVVLTVGDGQHAETRP